MEEVERLPPEVWVHVFSYLTTEEKHTVRTCCRYMKTLVDHPFLWKTYTVVLSDLRRYTYGFWDTLNQRRLTRVAVRHLRRKEWRRLVKFLPTLTAIGFMHGDKLYREKYLDSLSHFPNLRVFGVRDNIWSGALLSRSLSEHLQERLTHLSLCNVQVSSTVQLLSTVAHLKNLKFLLFHQIAPSIWPDTDTVRPVPRTVFHHMLVNLKKLKHLSWGMKGEAPKPLDDDYFDPIDFDPSGAARYIGPTLTSLELLDYPESVLPEDALKNLTTLKSLTVHYKYMREGITCRLGSWLNPLQQLENLTIIVTRLTLRVGITLKDMDLIAPAVPGLEHLDIEQNRSSGSLCKRIPMLFPQLKTLRIRFNRKEPENDLLNLLRLQHLKRLDLLVDRSFSPQDDMNNHTWPTSSVQKLIDQLRRLSRNRISIVTEIRSRNLLRECNCLKDAYREDDFIS
ncbi:uncharacterized protein LOC141806868 isoform X2 [Halichoeres trimaculatus]|uniref:uncharacterized protein LOC141806868 isoform X2 n=1 Tax=Halichoeres trimaculatus TaxID=147232 RepID=UPI003D9DEC4C